MYYRHGNHHKTPGKVFSQKVLTKRNFSNKLWTKGNACRTWLKLAEYKTDNKVIRELLNKFSFRKFHNGRIRYASLRAKSKKIYHRPENHHKTTGLVFSQQVLAKRNFSDSLWTTFSPCRKELKLSEYTTGIEVNMNQVISAVSGSY